MNSPTGQPDPLSVRWPRSTEQAILRPVSMDDVDAMWAFRSLPEVCRFLSHPPLTRDEVAERIAGRVSGVDPTPGRLVRGLAIVVDGQMSGDAMLRVQPGADGDDELWIGYALHPRIQGRGIATEVARELVSVGTELGLRVWADALLDNRASQRVLEKAGFRRVSVVTDEDGHRLAQFRV